MNTEKTFEQAAQDSYNAELEDVRKGYEYFTSSEDVDYDEKRETLAQNIGSPLEVSNVRCIQSIQILLTTGGPARGYYIFVDSDNEPSSGFYWYQDWFQPKRVFWLDSEQLRQVVAVYDLWLGD